METRYSDSCVVCRIWALEADLALQSSFPSLPSRSCYPHLHQRNPSALCMGTSRAIISDWGHKHKGTQTLLDIAMSCRREFDVHCPAYIADEFLLLLANICEGQQAHILTKQCMSSHALCRRRQGLRSLIIDVECYH